MTGLSPVSETRRDRATVPSTGAFESGDADEEVLCRYVIDAGGEDKEVCAPTVSVKRSSNGWINIHHAKAAKTVPPALSPLAIITGVMPLT